VELRFNQYMGRADMWRLAMSLEGTTLHVGERLTLAGGAVRAEVYGIWRNSHRFASGILTAKTKTIYRSRSAQVYIFIQLCQETWEFDEDGERYYEKIVHGEQSSHVRWQIADNLQASFLIYLHAGAKKAHRI
jgi:hypothetical protein